MTYDDYVTAMTALLVVDPQANDSEFEAIIPRMIESAEGRLYRDLDFLSAVAAPTAALTANSHVATVPASINILNAINVITPSSATNPELGTRRPLQRTSVEFIDAVYPSASGASVPKYYALLSDTVVRLGPASDAAYTAEFIGPTTPDPLSPTNTTTFLSVNLPDLLIAASMIFGAGYQRDFGAQADDPKLATSWLSQYQMLKDAENIQELRRKAKSWQWTAQTPSPIANMPRSSNAA